MAQVTSVCRSIFMAGVLLAAPESHAQASAIPPEAIRAEGETRLDDALDIYRQIVRRHPDRADVWLRMADIHAVMKQPGEAAQATANAARTKPQDAALQARLSQALAMNNEPAAALAAVRQAVSLQPANTRYLQAQAELAAWNGDLALAEQSYQAILKITPDQTTALREIAHLQSRSGQLDRSVATYQTYAAAQPQDHAALLDYAVVQMYRGDFQSARQLLDHYRDRAGPTEAYRKTEADLAARAGRPGESLEKVSLLLQVRPEDYELHLTQTLALNSNREPGPARSSLSVLDRLGPQRPETRGVHLLVETPLRSDAGGFAHYYGDSNALSQNRHGFSGGVQATDAMRMSLLIEQIATRANAGSGLQSVTGAGSEQIRHEFLGFRYQFLPGLALDLGAGSFDPETAGGTSQYRLGVYLWPVDTLSAGIIREHDLVTVSPRAVSLGIERDRNRLNAEWQWGYASTFALDFELSEYSDGNRSQELIFSPRFAVARTERHNLDLGMRGQWLQYDANPGNGYYSPNDFRRYWGTARYYWKASENAGVSVALRYGLERDSALDPDYRWSGDASLEGVFGIYGDWQLRTYAGYGGRVDSAAFQGSDYNGRSAGLELIRRF